MPRTIALTMALAVVSAATASAHHSYAAYDREHPVSIEGEIAELLFANPHVVVTIHARNVDYIVEWQSLNQLTRRNVTSDTLKVGDHVVLTAAPMHDQTQHRLSLVTEVRRPSDGWQWAR